MFTFWMSRDRIKCIQGDRCTPINWFDWTFVSGYKRLVDFNWFLIMLVFQEMSSNLGSVFWDALRSWVTRFWDWFYFLIIVFENFLAVASVSKWASNWVSLKRNSSILPSCIPMHGLKPSYRTLILRGLTSYGIKWMIHLIWNRILARI